MYNVSVIVNIILYLKTGRRKISDGIPGVCFTEYDTGTP